jgi:S-formylglutathione hydrolase FrmB
MHKRAFVVVALVAAVLTGLVGPMARARAATPPTFVSAAGITVAGATPIGTDGRQYDVQVSTPALGRAVDVRILLPTGYDAAATQRYPVLYLFHGTSGRASDWVNFGKAAETTANLPLITVMPDAGFDGDGGGWFTNWVDTATKLGPSQWETFHVNQLIPWIDANLLTIADRTGRAVAGLSQGGFGSTTYAARHPDTFVSVGSFSGAPDIDYNPGVAVGATGIIQATAFFLDGVEQDAMFGPRQTDEINWQGHDPADLVTNLHGVDIWLFTATGAPGPLDPAPPNPAAMGIEWATYNSTRSFAQRADQLGVPYHLNDYTLGTHSWPYWTRDLQQYVGPLMQTFSNPPPAPPTTSYDSIDKSWTQWGWRVDVDRSAAQQFTRLAGANAAGFTLQGTGTATVVTPSFYAPGSTKTVSVSTLTAESTSQATADDNGHLHLTVPLGADQIGSAAVMGVPGVPPLPTATVTVT